MSDSIQPMTSTTNDALREFWRRWRLEGDWMTCVKCTRNLIASRDGEILPHAEKCKNSANQHPWRELRDLLNGKQSEVRTEESILTGIAK
jgi:hypothetical protein